MISVTEKSVAFFLMQESASIEKILDDDVLLELESIVCDSDFEVNNSDFKELIIIKIQNETIYDTCKNNEYKLTNNDKIKVMDWINSDDKKIYSDDFFRLDFDNFILLFRMYTLHEQKILLGHVLENSTGSKLNLYESRQRYLMRTFF